ncbi:MAG: hypothetical protein GC192_19050 [Bacteroidetes bacterium]|nr:hypothetical protein [Bacteroidota bacterium]
MKRARRPADAYFLNRAFGGKAGEETLQSGTIGLKIRVFQPILVSNLHSFCPSFAGCFDKIIYFNFVFLDACAKLGFCSK